MKRYVYGKSFSRVFYALEDDLPLELPTQNPTIYVFRDMPSRDQAQDGSGAVATVSAWTQGGSSPFPCTYVVPAIADPDPDHTAPRWTYYEAINFVNVAAGQVQTVIRSFELDRTEELDAVPGVAISDLTAAYPTITAYYDNDELEDFISLCQDELKDDLKDRGIEWARAYDLDDVKRALAYKVLAEASFANIKEENDRFDRRYRRYSKKYSEYLPKIRIPVDTDGDGAPDKEQQVAEPFFVVIR